MVYNSIYDDSLCLIYFYLLMQIYFILYIFTTFFLFKYWESVCKSTWKSTWRLIALHGIQNLSIKRVAKKGNWYGNCIKYMYLKWLNRYYIPKYLVLCTIHSPGSRKKALLIWLCNKIGKIFLKLQFVCATGISWLIEFYLNLMDLLRLKDWSCKGELVVILFSR